MRREFPALIVVGVLIGLAPLTSATTRDIAELQLGALTFEQSVVNQLTFDTYRDPFDELQTRPFNLLFTNIGRHPNLSPWQGQEGSYTRYLNALIGNNGKANVDNDADALQGALIRRETAALAWGLSAAVLAGSSGSDDASGTSTFSDDDDLSGLDLRAALARQVSERSVLGAGVRATLASSEVADSSFEQGVGGFFGASQFEQASLAFDVGMRRFLSTRSSWEIVGVAGFGTVEQDEFSDSLDDTGAVTDRFVVTNFDITDLNLGLYAGYNRLKPERLGETELRLGLQRSQRELDNADLSFSESGGVVTPSLTLLNQDAVASTRLQLSAKSIFEAGETEMFAGAQLAYSLVDGATQVDSLGTIVNEAIDDSQLLLGLTLGLRQPLFSDKIRFIVSGRADLVNAETATLFDTGSDSDDGSRSVAAYAIGIEGVLANVTFDIAWLSGEEAPVVPVALGLPSGSRRTVEIDRLVFSAAVSW